MSDAFAAHLVTVLAWDDERGGLPSSFDEHPQFAWRTPGETRTVRSPVRLRLDDADGIHVLGDAGAIVHLDSEGAPLGRTPPPETRGAIIDFASDVAGDSVLLERLDEGGSSRLRCLDVSGAEQWSRGAPPTPGGPGHAGDFAKVLRWGDRLYLPDRRGQGVAQVDAESGELCGVLPQRHGAGAPFLGGGRLVSAFFDSERNRRGIVALDPNGGETAELAGTDEHYAWLVHPFGADRRSRLYVWRDGRVARVSLSGDIEILGEINGIAVRAIDGSVFTSHRGPDHLVVSGPGTETTVPAPDGFRLVHVDGKRRYHLLGGEAPDSAGELRVHAPDGGLESTGPAPDDLMAIDCRLPTYDAWQVDAEGRVVVPVVTPDGVAVVRLHPR